jgi:DMSO/TMAO reductase YedYZ molybdopterin-dependent catalytic subunit
VTPSELFYVRSHFPVPAIDASSWRLTVRGLREVEFTLDELRRLPAETRTVTLECAGNGRIALSPAVEGVQWHLGAVSTAAWTGVPLAKVLERAGVAPGSVEIVFEGADRGRPKQTPRPPQPIAYAHGVPVGHAGDVLLAWAMNGEPLTREHGYPLRAVASGYYAMVSVKWLTRICMLREPFQGYYKTTDYAYWDQTDGLPVQRPLSLMPLKSQIARPSAGQMVQAGSTVRVVGAAWTGGAPIDRVEVSSDGGQTWHTAQILDPHEHGVWRRWQWTWHAPQVPGQYTLRSRAIDQEGQMQPAERDPRFATYCIHHIVPVGVRVR